MKEDALRIAFCNAKGGTSKTTTTQNVAHALANKKKKVLVVDFDPQASLTYCFGLTPEDCEFSIADVLLEGVDINSAIVKTSIEGVDLVSGSIFLSSFDTAMSNDDSRETKLKEALREVSGYDFILLDTAPTAGMLMVNALLATDKFIIPVVPQYLAFQGLATMLGVVERVRGGYGECASLMGILLSQCDYRNKATHELIKLIKEHYKTEVFKREVRINVRVSEAPSFGKSIFQHDWASTGAESYRMLADEIIKRSKQIEVTV